MHVRVTSITLTHIVMVLIILAFECHKLAPDALVMFLFSMFALIFSMVKIGKTSFSREEVLENITGANLMLYAQIATHSTCRNHTPI